MKLKVCGLRDNISEVAELSPDFTGFIFYPKSPRYVGEGFVMPNISTKKVGVFVNEQIDKVLALKKQYGLDYIQLHGDENVDYCVELMSNSTKIIKVFAGNNLPSQNELDRYHPFVSYYLFDTKLDKPGGNGVTFDWNSLSALQINKPYFLSGGIGTESIEKLNEIKNPPMAIDVNSRFEISPGLKDIEKLRILKNKLP